MDDGHAKVVVYEWSACLHGLDDVMLVVRYVNTIRLFKRIKQRRGPQFMHCCCPTIETLYSFSYQRYHILHTIEDNDNE